MTGTVEILNYLPLEEVHFIEDIGLYFERLGMPRMAGRILGVLLISEASTSSSRGKSRARSNFAKRLGLQLKRASGGI